MNKQKHASELIPQNEDAIKILQARAAELARPEVNLDEENAIAFVRFNLSENEQYGIPYQYIQEILSTAPIAPLPLVPNLVAGVINWRGILITVVNLALFLNPNSTTSLQNAEEEKCILVVQSNKVTLGLLVHRIERSETYLPEQLAAPLFASQATPNEYILGLHDTFTAIINLEALVSILCQEIKRRLYQIGEVHEH